LAEGQGRVKATQKAVGKRVAVVDTLKALLKLKPDVVVEAASQQAVRDWGEAVVAFVVANAATPVGEDALDALCLDHLARFKRPKRYVFIEGLPKNNYGKVLKTELRRRLATAREEH